MKKFILVIILIVLVGTPAVAKMLTARWDASVDPTVIGYKIYQSSVSGQYVKGEFIHDVPGREVSSLNFDVTSPDGTYYWVITAYDADLESDFSNEVSLTLDTEAPEPPTGFQTFWQIIVSFFNNLFGGFSIG